MSRRRLLILAIIVGILVMAITVSLALFLNRSGKPGSVATPANKPSGSPTPATAAPVPAGDNDRAVLDQRNAEINQNPLLSRLPHDTGYWSLNWNGSEGDRYVLSAIVFYHPGEDPKAKIDQQRPYIERFVSDTGQPAGTYVINYSSRLVESD